MQYFLAENSSEELFVLFHGTGGNEYSLLFLTGELNPHASIISFIGENDQGKNRRFFNPLVNGHIDEVEFQQAIDDFITQWQEMDTSKYENITFIGYSNGANFIQGLLQRLPALADKVILMHPQEFECTFAEGHYQKPQLLITTGANDTLAIAGNILKLKTRLHETYSDTQLILTDGFHEVSQSEVDKIKEWYQKR